MLAGAFRLLPALNQILFLSNQVQFSGSAIGLVEHELTTFGRVRGHTLRDRRAEAARLTDSSTSCSWRT